MTTKRVRLHYWVVAMRLLNGTAEYQPSFRWCLRCHERYIDCFCLDSSADWAWIESPIIVRDYPQRTLPVETALDELAQALASGGKYSNV